MEYTTLQHLLSAVLKEAIQVDCAFAGHMQIATADQQGLRIVAQHGFKEPFLKRFEFVPWSDMAASFQAFREGSRVLVSDVRTEPSFAAYTEIAMESGFVSVQSTPLLSSTGNVMGVLSTHFREPKKDLSLIGQRILDNCAAAASHWLEPYLTAVRKSSVAASDTGQERERSLNGAGETPRLYGGDSARR